MYYNFILTKKANLPDLKEPTIFLYCLIHNSEFEESYKDNLRTDEDLRYLRENKYFSVKALSFLEECE
jgi:hypothetical protein